MRIYLKALIFIFIVVNICYSEIKPVEILSLKNDSTVFVTETGETYFSSDLELTVNDSGSYSISYNFAGNTASHIFELSKGKQTLTFNIYSRNLLGAEVSFSSIKCCIILFPQKSGAGITVDEKEFKLSRTYDPEEFIRKTAVISDTTQSIEDIARSIGNTLLLTQQRNRDPLYPDYGAGIVPLEKFFPKTKNKNNYILTDFMVKDGMMLHSSYIAVSKDKKSAFIIDSKNNFNSFVKTLDLKTDNIEEAKKQALAYLLICENCRSDITILEDTPHYVWEWPFKKSKHLSIHKWFACNKDKAKFHKPEIFNHNNTVIIRFYTHEGFMGQLKYHTFIFKENGEIISYIVKHLGFNIGRWYII